MWLVALPIDRDPKRPSILEQARKLAFRLHYLDLRGVLRQINYRRAANYRMLAEGTANSVVCSVFSPRC